MSPIDFIKRCVGAFTNNQFVMFGTEGSGKTTLLYRLKVANWKTEDLLKDLDKSKNARDASHADPGYHFEEFGCSTIKKYAIWDVPGSPLMQMMWPTFYRYIKVSAVIFVVDALDSLETEFYLERTAKARELLHHLLAEDELRGAAFILIINDKHFSPLQKVRYLKEVPEGAKDKSLGEKELAKVIDDWKGYDEKEDPLDEMLGVPEIMAQDHNKIRFRKFIFDVQEVQGETGEWIKVLEEIRKIIIASGGSP